MKINNVQFTCSIEDILDKLQEELKKKNSDLLSTYKRSKDYLIVPCPYHGDGNERHPSAEFRDEDGLFWCFTCHTSKKLTDVIHDCLGENGWTWLLKNFKHVEAKDRQIDINLDRTNKKEKIEHVNKNELDKYRFIHEYVLNRGISKEIIKKFDIGYDKENDCIVFPNKDIDGNIILLATRSVKGKRFNYPYASKKPVYGLYEIERERAKGHEINEIYICESMLDALSIWSWGKYAVALNGTGSKAQYDILNKFNCREYILALDNDEAGKVGREKLKQHLKNKIVKQISYKSYGDCKDINDMTKEQFDGAKIIWA